MDGLQAAADAEGEDTITEEHTVTKTMTPRIDDLLSCVVGSDGASLVNCDDIDLPLPESTSPDIHRKSNKSPIPNSGDEKCDADPENSRKSCDVTPDTADEISLGDNIQLDGASCNSSTDNKLTTIPNKDNIICDESSEMSKSALAFTIDFNDGKQVDSKKKNDIFERFQKRHRRGASMSKLEGSPSAQTSVKSKPPLKKGESTPSKTALLCKTTNASASVDDSISMPSNCSVKMRDKTRLSRKDAANSDQRHSWSPRNSMQLSENRNAVPAVESSRQKSRTADKSYVQKSNSFQPKSDTLQRAFQSIKASYPLTCRDNDTHDPDPVVCGAPPLEYIPSSSPNGDGSISSVSEAGTYTLDGDNYTEEQKQQMSIDRCSKAFAATSTALGDPTNSLKTKTSYLDRIKSKVKNISDRTFHKKPSPEATLPSKPLNPTSCPPPNTLDLGSFTSVTSAGVFSKHTIQQQITPKIRTSRKGSLSKSQIDNSEYIQKMDEQMLNSFTDYEKARHNDYQLNIFSGQLVGETAAQPNSIPNSDSFGIERAETKNDWIQEWAKNARRNTKKKVDTVPSNPKLHNNVDRNEYEYKNFQHKYETQGGTSSSEFSDVNVQARMNRRNQMVHDDGENFSDDIHRYEMRKFGNRQEQSPYQSVRSGSGRRGSLNAFVHKNAHSEFGDDLDDDQSTGSSLQPSSLMLDGDRLRRNFYQFECIANPSSRPPLSPTKIPSPMHSLSRPRSSSVNRSMHSSITVSKWTRFWK